MPKCCKYFPSKAFLKQHTKVFHSRERATNVRIEESELQKGEASVEYMKNTCTKENVNHITSDDSQD